MSNFCKRCGQALPAGASFCMTCGTMVTPTPPANAPSSAAPNTPQNLGGTSPQGQFGGQGGAGFGHQGGQGNLGGQPNYGAQANPGGFTGQGGYSTQQQQAYQQQQYGGAPGYARSQEPSATDYMFMPLKRYAEFSGRSRRKEYWMFTLMNVIVYAVVAGIILAGIPWAELEYNPNAQPGPLVWVGGGLGLLWILAMFIPTIAVTVRRFHDQNQSGWMYLIQFIPYIGGFIVLIFMCIDGNRGPNKYGPDPKSGGVGDVFQ